ncbi:EamA family transporter [Undibacterium sp. Ren11W]|uniref:EamA family transporter n=1 Tax=Undibacterium sp. Ren11W TaxID=3413045 RepID=UPI003BF2E4A7
MSNFIYLSIYVLGMVLGQILFKSVALSLHGNSLMDLFLSLMKSFKFYAAISLYGVLTIYWIWLLRKISLSYAYPFVAMSIAIVVFAGYVIWDEKLKIIQMSGIVLILLGVVFLGLAGEFSE